MTTLRLRALPLTPIHVGNGDILAPEDYLLQDDCLVRFHRAAVLRDMAPEQRRRLETLLDKDDFSGAQGLLRAACDPKRHALSRIYIGDESRNALQMLIKNPASPIRQREVHPFIANPLTGRPYLPGSSIKGAIRTALVNYFAGPEMKRLEPVLQEIKIKKRWQALETEALKFSSDHMENDPLRLFKVADVQLPADSTRIDRALQFKFGKGLLDIQMHYERLLCRGDGLNIEFPVELELDEVAAAKPEVKTGRRLTLDLIRDACNRFYSKRLLTEQARFFSDDAIPESRYGAQGLMKLQNGKLLLAKSVGERGMLLRVGRFSHFESLSVDGLREGWNIQKRKPITEGSSRTLCRCRSGNEGRSMPLPFGWLLLAPEQ